jgi:CheY-like chemotaxis protein
MAPTQRPPPKVLFVHDGIPYEAHMRHLVDAGLSVSEAHVDSAVDEAAALQPDIIVLDYACNGETTARLKSDPQTSHIPVIALVELTRPL